MPGFVGRGLYPDHVDSDVNYSGHSYRYVRDNAQPGFGDAQGRMDSATGWAAPPWVGNNYLTMPEPTLIAGVRWAKHATEEAWPGFDLKVLENSTRTWKYMGFYFSYSRELQRSLFPEPLWGTRMEFRTTIYNKAMGWRFGFVLHQGCVDVDECTVNPGACSWQPET
eukprot:2500093-Rhodomonas_salina.1